MALPLWGELQRSQDDPTTIEEFIDEKIAEHEADPEAHLGEGESLEKHKTEGMIDHPAGSVAVDKFAQAHFIVTAFESLDGWLDFMTGTASRVSDFGSVQLSTGTTSNSNNYLYAVPSVWIPFDTAKEFFWKAAVKLTATTNQEARFGIGAPGGGDGISGAGFEVENGTLYAYTDDGEDVDRTQINGVTITDFHIYEVRHFPDTDTFEFYIDGTLVHSEVRTFTNTQDDTMAIFRIKNTAGEQKRLYVTDMQFQIER